MRAVATAEIVDGVCDPEIQAAFKLLRSPDQKYTGSVYSSCRLCVSTGGLIKI